MAKYKLVATAAMGLEAIVAQEVQALGYETTCRKWQSIL